jgi:formiminotetrahydrofolate cyclodeaminase
MAAVLAYSAMESARLNVEINLAGIKDEGFKTQIRSEVGPLIEKGKQATDEIRVRVEGQVIK